MKGTKVYLASAYTHEDPEIMEHRFNRACETAGRFMKQGYLVFSPIAHTHPIAVACGLPRHSDFWMAYDETFLEWCDELWILGEHGWDVSKGIKQEIEIAERLGKPVKIYIPALGEVWPLKEEWNHEVDKDNSLRSDAATRGGDNS